MMHRDTFPIHEGQTTTLLAAALQRMRAKDVVPMMRQSSNYVDAWNWRQPQLPP